MADWIDHLTKEEAQAILDSPIKTRFPARNDAGDRAMRYAKPTAAEMERIRRKAGG